MQVELTLNCTNKSASNCAKIPELFCSRVGTNPHSSLEIITKSSVAVFSDFSEPSLLETELNFICGGIGN